MSSRQRRLAPKNPDPFAGKIRSRLEKLRELNSRAPAKQSLKAIAVQLKALSMEAERLVRS